MGGLDARLRYRTLLEELFAPEQVLVSVYKYSSFGYDKIFPNYAGRFGICFTCARMILGRFGWEMRHFGNIWGDQFDNFWPRIDIRLDERVGRHFSTYVMRFWSSKLWFTKPVRNSAFGRARPRFWTSKKNYWKYKSERWLLLWGQVTDTVIRSHHKTHFLNTIVRTFERNKI